MNASDERPTLPREWPHSIQRALGEDPSLETWSGHFEHRLPEFEEILQYWPGEKVGTALEVGCGNGLAAVYFSPLAGKIVASDLPNVDHQAHSIGLSFAKSFVEKMKLANVEVLGCSAERIPLPDASFHLVYGIYCLEHVPDRSAALKETLRVLRPGGMALFTVPGAAWALQFPLSFYTELMQRIWARIRRKLFPTKASSASAIAAETSTAKVTGPSSFFRYYPHFPFPEPHGAHSSWPAEIEYYRKSNWERVARLAGFENVRVHPISFLPKHLKALLPAWMANGIEAFCRDRPGLHRFAQFFCIQCIKTASP